MNTVVCDDLHAMHHVSLRVPTKLLWMRDCCALSVHGQPQPLSCLCFAATVGAERMTSRMRIIFACSYLPLFFLIPVFSYLSFARISTYGIHVVRSCFLVWYLYFYCACVFVFLCSFLFFKPSFNIRRNWISCCCDSISGIVLFLLVLFVLFSVGTSLCVARL